MYERLLTFLRCPDCDEALHAEDLRPSAGGAGEIMTGLLHCEKGHWFPVVGGIPRMLPGSLAEHWREIGPLARSSSSEAIQSLAAANGRLPVRPYDRRTRTSFSSEWDQHQLGDPTWGMKLGDRVQWFFLDPLRIPEDELAGQVMLDAGCGNGSQSVAYTELGLEVIALDISSGLEHGHAFRHVHPGARPDRVHFVQADLQRPPLAPASVDIVHSVGVLHHTPDTQRTFRALTPLVKPGGTFFVWVYKKEPVVTALVNSIRAVTTRIPPSAFARVADVLGPAFIGFCRAVDKLGLRTYPAMKRREASLALMDIFGAPHAHYHSYPELEGWYHSEGFRDTWPCNDGRRGFGVCGRKTAEAGQGRG